MNPLLLASHFTREIAFGMEARTYLGHNNCSPPPPFCFVSFFSNRPLYFCPLVLIFFSARFVKTHFPEKPEELSPTWQAHLNLKPPFFLTKPDHFREIGQFPRGPFSQALKRELQEMTLRSESLGFSGVSKKKTQKNTNLKWKLVL